VLAFDNNHRSPNAVTREWDGAKQAAGMPEKVTLHSLRHTHRTNFLRTDSPSLAREA
jgi:integrase